MIKKLKAIGRIISTEIALSLSVFLVIVLMALGLGCVYLAGAYAAIAFIAGICIGGLLTGVVEAINMILELDSKYPPK
jgi:hypothetical protein